MQLSVLGRSIIVLNTAEQANNLMEKRGVNFSDRPNAVLQGGMCVYYTKFCSRYFTKRLVAPGLATSWFSDIMETNSE